MSKGKICFISGVLSRSGGTERVGILIANYLESQGYDVEILSFWNEGPPYFYVSETIKINYFLNHWEGKLFRTLIYPIMKLHHFFKKEKYDLVISIDIILNKYTLPALTGLQTKHLSWEHFNYEFEISSKNRLEALGRLEKYDDNLLVLTQKDKRMMIELGGLSPEKVFQIYNPTTFKSSRNSILSSKKIVSVGRLIDVKNYSNLIDVWSMLENQFEDWQLEIYGEGEDHSVLDRKIKELGLKRIFLRGHTTDVQKIMMDSSIYVMTSKHEGFPMVLLEAMSVGLPIVSYDIQTGPDEMIKNNVTGFLVDYGDTEEFANKLSVLIKNKKLRDDFSKKTLETVKNFSIDLIGEKWKTLIDELISER